MSGNLSLLERISQMIDAGDLNLPPANHITEQLQNIIADPDFDLTRVVELISQDVVLTAEILRFANSTFYGGLSQVKTVREAAVRLGPPEVVRLAVLVTEKNLYQVKSPKLAKLLGPLWDHAQATALGARWLTRKMGYQDLENQAFIGGLLHDVGSLLLVRVMDEIFAEDPQAADISDTLIMEIIQTAHCSEGYKMAVQWGLPELYCEIIRDHQSVNPASASTLLNIITLVDKACVQLGLGLEHEESIVLAATEEAYVLGTKEVALAQLSIFLEDEMQLVG